MRIKKMHVYSRDNEEKLKIGFDGASVFWPMRIEPSFLPLKNISKKVSDYVEDVILRMTGEHSGKSLIHGDLTSKNILVKNCKAILIDAECSFFSEPQFDLAFVISDLLFFSIRYNLDLEHKEYILQNFL